MKLKEMVEIAKQARKASTSEGSLCTSTATSFFTYKAHGEAEEKGEAGAMPGGSSFHALQTLTYPDTEEQRHEGYNDQEEEEEEEEPGTPV